MRKMTIRKDNYLVKLWIAGRSDHGIKMKYSVAADGFVL